MRAFLITKILSFIFYLLVRFIYLTNKKVFHHPSLNEKEAYLIAFWHGELLMQSFNYRKLRNTRDISVIISEHKDGEIISRIGNYLGIKSIRGSSSKGGARVLIKAIKELKSNNDIAITPDGPRGPRFSIADGVVAISKKTNAKILIFNCKASSYWQFKSWDKFVLPKPFGTLEFFIQDPLDISDLEMDEAKELIKQKMLLNAMK